MPTSGGAAAATDRETGRPIADILIGAFAQRFQGLVTRNREHFRLAFPALAIREPAG